MRSPLEVVESKLAEKSGFDFNLVKREEEERVVLFHGALGYYVGRTGVKTSSK